MITGSPPYPGENIFTLVIKTNNQEPADYRLPKNASNEIKTFLDATFKIKKEERPTAKQLILDPFVACELHFLSYISVNII